MEGDRKGERVILIQCWYTLFWISVQGMFTVTKTKKIIISIKLNYQVTRNTLLWWGCNCAGSIRSQCKLTIIFHRTTDPHDGTHFLSKYNINIIILLKALSYTIHFLLLQSSEMHRTQTFYWLSSVWILLYYWFLAEMAFLLAEAIIIKPSWQLLIL